MTSEFEDHLAVREKTPIMVGLVGPSGSGKTFSALRLATGLQRVTGGDIHVIDTEAKRALYYADNFRFRHVNFRAPFGPLRYLEAIQHCVGRGASTVIVDSMSHEHEGPGGILEMHAAGVERMSKGDAQKAERVKMLAWAKPKAERRLLINSLLQMQCNFIFCFRAKEKLKIERGKEPQPLGFMPIAGEEFIYEMTLNMLLLPSSKGTPSWHPAEMGERAIVKLPQQFDGLFRGSPQLSEDIGEALGRWSAGGASPRPGSELLTFGELVAQYEACPDPATLRALKDQRSKVWNKLSKEQQESVRVAAERAKARIDEQERRTAEAPTAPADITDEEQRRIEEDERRGYTTNPDEGP